MKGKYFVSSSLAVLVVVWGALEYPNAIITPGGLQSGHEDLDQGCFVCHTPFLGSTDEKCMNCHAVEDIGLLTTDGQPIIKQKHQVRFHQELTAFECTSCHSEHQGVQPFRQSLHFSHELLSSSVQQQCDTCHIKPQDSLHSGLDANCSSCHETHQWTPATFDHDKYFRFDRYHPDQCDSCHQNNKFQTYSCYNCHEHSVSNVREEHLEEGIRDFEQCTECHRSGDEDEAEMIWKQTRGIRYRHQRDDD